MASKPTKNSGNEPTVAALDRPRRDHRRRDVIALAALVPAPLLGTVAAMVLDLGVAGQVIYGFSKVWIAVLPLVWLRYVEHGRFSLSPMRRDEAARGIGVGTALGLVISAVILGGYLLLGSALLDPERIVETARQNDLHEPWRFFAFSVYLIGVNSLIEEYVWRWFVFRKCEALVGGRIAIVLSALLFTAHHVVALRVQMPWTPALLCSAGVFIGGAAWSWCYLRYRSIWPGYISHAIVDLAILAIGWDLIIRQSAIA